MLGKRVDHRVALGPPGGMAIGRLLGPLERERGGDDRPAARFEVAHEIGQEMTGALELEAELAPQGEVCVEPPPEHAHDAPPGQGWTIERSASLSTLIGGTRGHG